MCFFADNSEGIEEFAVSNKLLNSVSYALVFNSSFNTTPSNSGIPTALASCTAASSSVFLNEMEKKGLIERNFKPDNNTPINKITAKGKEFFEKNIKKIGEIIIPKMDEEFTQEEIDQFISYLKRFRKVAGSIPDVKLK